MAWCMAEVHGNRTHHGPVQPVTGFEVQEAHQDLSTSKVYTKRFSLSSQSFRLIGLIL